MKCRSFIFLLLVCIGKCSGQSMSPGDSCTIASTKVQGKCIRLDLCDEAKQNLQRRIYPQHCGFDNDFVLVCCNVTRVVGEISKTQCREYSKYSKVKYMLPFPRRGRPNYIIRDECGQKAIRLIVGGKKADRREFPHMAAIGFEETPGDIKWLCGGTIISDQYILTAAHCLSHRDFGKASYVLIGVHVLDKKSMYRQEIKIAERIPHPDYTSSSHYNDIALLKLQRPANLTSSAKPACLHLEYDTFSEKAIATGWGDTHGGGVGSNELLKVTLDLFSYDMCNSSYKNQRKLKHGIIDSTQLCAGSKDDEKEKDTCQGDSGGPLQTYHDGTKDNVTCMYDVVGITSFGKACTGGPGIYTRVSHYIKWIEDIVWPLEKTY